jgi:RNA polymerase sigma-70 factor (ECF subfamily)
VTLHEPAPTNSKALFRRYAVFVASFLHRLGARPDEIDDLVQDVFLTVHRKGGYRPGAASATTFLARIALEARHGKRRKDSRWRAARSSDAASAIVASHAIDPGQALVAKRAAQRLDSALTSMDPDHRAVFILFELHGESCESIAAGLDLKLGTVYSRLHAARRAFRAAAAKGTPEDGKEDEGVPVFGGRRTA